MAKYSKLEVAVEMRQSGLVPVFYHPSAEAVKDVVTACYDGGLRIFEFTNRGDFAHEVFSEVNKYVIENLPGMIMGVGSVVDPGTATLYIQSGANFIVSPLLNEDTARICNLRKVSWTPGCATASEISKANELGADVVKVFPANLLGGPKFISSVKGPMPWCNLMPSGGVSPDRENLQQWFEAGAFCVGMGSKLITKDVIKNNDYTLLKDSVSEVLNLISEIKESL
jgi:2-dehydro-3-deoxyphosphogluconate aldolase/(4S)-4-hydroxy-2-oxoglutarate aldolase